MKLKKNIEKVGNLLDSKKLQRTELSAEINKLKKDIKYWQELDKSQLKMF